MPIQWDSQYETGEMLVDNQHKRLFDFVNRLEGMVKRTATAEEAESVMSFLSMYLKVHFLYEESCMYKHACAAHEVNKVAHKQFLEAFNKFKERYEREGGTPSLMRDIYNAAQTWLINHICKIDVRLRTRPGAGLA